MIDCKEREIKGIVIKFSGDREDYVNTIKTLVRLMANQAEPNRMDNLMCSNLIDDMLSEFLE